MALNVGELSAALSLDTSDFDKKLDETDGKVSKTGSNLDGVRAKATAGFAIMGTAAVAFGLSSAKAASDLNESVSKTDNVFKGSAATIHEWAAGAAKGFGQSKTQAEGAASSFGNMFVQLGISSDAAAGMSMQMTELASDFASFHNADISEVLLAQQAAFRGEYDSVQRFVPTINAVAVEQQALSMGLAATTGELTAQDKALATQTLMLQGAGDALGDFDRTADGAANKQRILTAQFDDQKAAIGDRLLPILTTLAGFFSDNFNTVMVVVAVVVAAATLAFGVFAIQSAVTAAVVAAGWVTMGAQALAGAARMAAAWLIALGPIGLVIAAIAGVVYLIIRNWDTVKSATGAAWDWVREKISSTVAWFGSVPGQISNAFRGAFDGLKEAFKSSINWIIGKWNNLSFGIPAVDIPGIGKVGGATIDTPNIPYLAKGGTAVQSGLAIVGERGPELLAMNRGASVIPLNEPAGRSEVIIENIEIKGVRDGNDVVRILPQLTQAIAAGVGKVR